MIESVQQSAGPSKAKVICDECEAEKIVPCGYQAVSPNKPKQPNASQARAKAISAGWSFVKGTLRCPDCEAKRKVVPMQAKEQKASVDTGARQMSKRDKIQIFTMLSEVYDIDAGRYMKGDTDEMVAEVLGVMPGWVAQIREEDFGPDGGNENIDELAQRLGEAEREIKALLQKGQAMIEAAEKKLSEVSTMRADLHRIKNAVGTRVLKRAGVNT